MTKKLTKLVAGAAEMGAALATENDAAPKWAVDNLDSHAPWPDPASDEVAIVTFDTATANYAVDAVLAGETLEKAVERVGGWLKPGHIMRIERPEPASDAHGMDFGGAICCLKRGQCVQRAGWNGKGMWLRYVGAEEWTTKSSVSVEPFIAVKTVQGTLAPWEASQMDVLADDWRVVG